MKIGIINYGMGNIFSIKQTVESLGYEAFIANYPKDLDKADKIILPGVGSFSKAMENLGQGGWTAKLNNLVKEANKIPLLGICLGMHLLARSSNEVSYTRGLSFIKGDVVSYDEYMNYHNFNDCKSKGVARVVDKDYIVQPNEIIEIRFNV